MFQYALHTMMCLLAISNHSSLNELQCSCKSGNCSVREFGISKGVVTILVSF